MPDYPLKFIPILKEKVWGGNKLKEVLNKRGRDNNLGESWEISAVEEEISIVSNGKFKGKNLVEILKEFREELVGKKVYKKFGNNFPLLIKFIDANTELSVQLHPNDKLAKERHNSYGKTEMWYILQADEEAKVIVGFKKAVDKEDYIKQLQEGNITSLLNFEKVNKGDAFFINTGKVHAICGGVLLAEIQQTSDITYRIYDWDRVDEQGNSRVLHTELALDAIDFEVKQDYKLNYDSEVNTGSKIADCKYFTTNFLPVKGEVIRNIKGLDSFVIYICTRGKATISVNNYLEVIKKGETLLIPAKCREIKIMAERAELLEVYID